MKFCTLFTYSGTDPAAPARKINTNSSLPTYIIVWWAQLVECQTSCSEVRGSIPGNSKIFFFFHFLQIEH